MFNTDPHSHLEHKPVLVRPRQPTGGGGAGEEHVHVHPVKPNLLKRQIPKLLRQLRQRFVMFHGALMCAQTTGEHYQFSEDMSTS